MKLYKLLFSVLFLLTLSINFSIAGGTREICPGQPATLVWTSSNADIDGCSGGVEPEGDAACIFAASTGGSILVDNAQKSCTVNYSCRGPGGRSVPDPDSAKLDVVNKAECCGTGSQVPYTGGWQAGNGGYCSCPVGQYKDPVTKACRNLIPPTITATSSGLLNPVVTPTCSAPMITKSIVRDTGPSTNLVVNGNTPITDLAITSLTSAATYTYTLTCMGTGDNSHIVQTTTTTINVPPKVKITNLQDISSPVGQSITTTWNSTGNECSIFARGPRTYVGTSYKNNTGVNASYAHSYTISPAVRGELNNSHVGTNLLGYDVECIDSEQPIRGTAVDAFTAEIFKKPTATITQNGNNLTFKCTPDYNKIDLKINNLSAPGYPKTYSIAPASAFSDTRPAAANSSYLLTCSYGVYSAQDGRTTGPVIAVDPSNQSQLSLFGAINGNYGIADAIVNDTNSADGKIRGLTYTAKNYDSISVTRKNNGVTVPNGSYAPVSGKAEITDGIDTAVYNNFELVIIATKGSGSSKITKTLTLGLIKDNNPKAILTVNQDNASTNQDAVSIGIRCENSDRYELYKNGSPFTSNAYAGNSILIADIATSTTNKTTYLLKCFSGSTSSSASAEYSLPSKTPAKITELIIQPNQIACPGGNDSATLRFMMSNTAGKVCRIIPTAISSLNNAPQKDIQMNALDTLLKSSIYKSSNSEGQKSLADVIADPSDRGISAGKIVLSSASKLSNDKRLFTYSTKFKLECDSKLATPKYVPTNVTYSTKSVEMLSACVGQD